MGRLSQCKHSGASKVAPLTGLAKLDESSASLHLVGLQPLMARSSGIPEIPIGLIDGPVTIDHPELVAANVHLLPGKLSGACIDASSTACAHGTFVAGILFARRGS